MTSTIDTTTAINRHYDFRRLGEPLGEDALPDAIMAREQTLGGHCNR